MARFSMDIKYMHPSNMGFSYILLCTCEITGFVVGIPIANLEAQTIAEAIFYRIICLFGTPEEIIMDQAKSFVSELMMTYLHTFNIKPFIVSPFNHGANRTERYIKTLNTMMCKYLRAKGEDWPKHVLPCCYAMNTQISIITGNSPHEMVFLRKPPDLLDFEMNPDQKGIKVGTEQYMKQLQDRMKDLKKLVLERKTEELKTQWIRDIRHYPNGVCFSIGDLIYLNYESGSDLQVPAKKLKQEWIGPLRIAAILDDTHYLISDWEGKLLPLQVHLKRMKPFILNTNYINQQGVLELASTSQQIRDKWPELKKANLHEEARIM